MTMELLSRILKENKIPENVHFMSDSGWECDPTEMDGVFYNRKNNTIVFTQSGCTDREYERSEDWEILYTPELIKIEDFEVYPVSSLMSHGITEIFKKELKEAGDFEEYYGFDGTEDAYKAIDLQRPMFYSIKKKDCFIGYIGFWFHEDENKLEPEIYIFRQYRNKGYGTRVLNKFIDMTFKDGLPKIWREKNKEGTLPRYSKREEMIYPSKLEATVRVGNTYSRKMMTTCGFKEDECAAAEFLAFIGEGDARDCTMLEVKKFSLTREEYFEGRRGK